MEWSLPYDTPRAGLMWLPFHPPFRRALQSSAFIPALAFQAWKLDANSVLVIPQSPNGINQNWSLLFEISRSYTIFLQCQTFSFFCSSFYFGLGGRWRGGVMKGKLANNGQQWKGPVLLVLSIWVCCSLFQVLIWIWSHWQTNILNFS